MNGAPVTNNFMMDEKMTSPTKDDATRNLAPFFHKHDIEIENGYPSESDA